MNKNKDIKKVFDVKKITLYRQNIQLANQIFQTGFVVTGGGFLSYCNHQLIKFEADKRLRL